MYFESLSASMGFIRELQDLADLLFLPALAV